MRFAALFVATATCAALSVVSSGARAQALTVAADPVAAPPPAAAAAAQPARTPAGPDRAAAPEHERSGVDLGGSFYLLSGTAVDDFKEGGFVLRPALELYAAFGAGEVTVELGGVVLGVEGTFSGRRTSVSIPALTAVAVRDDKWAATVAGGVSLATDNDYGDDHPDDEISLPSPRAELRAAYRFEQFGELGGIVGYERRLYTNREDESRLMFGVSIGIGGCGKQDHVGPSFR